MLLTIAHLKSLFDNKDKRANSLSLISLESRVQIPSDGKHYKNGGDSSIRFSDTKKNYAQKCW